jgi:hypothetical protein
VSLTRDGDRYRVTWTIDGETFRGTGTLSGNRLVVDSAYDGDVTHSEMIVGPDGRLSGRWWMLDDSEDSGREEWIPS